MTGEAQDQTEKDELGLSERAMLAAARSANRAAWFAAITSLIAILIGVYSAYLQRQQTRAQFWPHLEWGFSEIPQPRLYLINNGVGPALLSGIRISVAGKEMRRWSEVLAARGADPALINYSYSSIGGSRTIMAGESIDVFTPASGLADPDANHQQRQALLNLLRDPEVSLSYCYCSVFGECQTVLQGAGERVVGLCPESSTGGFLD